MRDILQEIAENRKKRIEEEKKKVPLKKLQEKEIPPHASFEEALKKDGISLICEIKKASPSKGIIAKTIDPAGIAREYEEAGAAAISCLSEPDYFLGSDEILQTVIQNTSLPVLRKDFVVDDYMIWQAAVYGAAAILLIVSLIDDPRELKRKIDLAHSLKLDVLTECRSEAEIRKAKEAGARIIGVNNRNLHDFSVDTNHALRLKQAAGEETIFVSESGIQNASQVCELAAAGTDAILIGETMMKAEDKKQMAKTLLATSSSPAA